MRTFTLTGAILLCLTYESFANGYLGPQCISLTPDNRGSDSTLPPLPLDQMQIRTAAYCLARVEGAEERGDDLVDADVKRVFIFQSTDGAYVVRILDLPPGFGVRGRF